MRKLWCCWLVVLFVCELVCERLGWCDFGGCWGGVCCVVIVSVFD